MKSFLISILSLGLVVCIWMVFDHYSERELLSLVSTIEDTAIPAIETEDWDGATNDFEEIEDQWRFYRKRAAFFYNTFSLNEIDHTMARAKHYIKANDVSNASGEMACLGTQVKLLRYNERFIGENIF